MGQRHLPWVKTCRKAFFRLSRQNGRIWRAGHAPRPTPYTPCAARARFARARKSLIQCLKQVPLSACLRGGRAPGREAGERPRAHARCGARRSSRSEPSAGVPSRTARRVMNRGCVGWLGTSGDVPRSAAPEHCAALDQQQQLCSGRILLNDSASWAGDDPRSIDVAHAGRARGPCAAIMSASLHPHIRVHARNSSQPSGGARV